MFICVYVSQLHVFTHFFIYFEDYLNFHSSTFIIHFVLQSMTNCLQYRPREAPAWHYNKNNVCGSGPQGFFSVSLTVKVTFLIIMPLWFLQHVPQQSEAQTSGCCSTINCLPEQPTFILCKHSCWDIHNSSFLLWQLWHLQNSHNSAACLLHSWGFAVRIKPHLPSEVMHCCNKKCGLRSHDMDFSQTWYINLRTLNLIGQKNNKKKLWRYHQMTRGFIFDLEWVLLQTQNFKNIIKRDAVNLIRQQI